MSMPRRHSSTTYKRLSASYEHQLSRRQNGGSLHNLSTVRHSYSGSPTPHKQGPRREPVFLTDEGIIRVYIRGRPVTFCVPSHLRDTYTPATPAPAPPARLQLDWVYGYRGRDCRNNLHQLPTGELVYFVAAVAVLYSPDDQLQRHYLGHTDDIKCLAVHPNRMIVATGQTAGNNRTDTRGFSKETVTYEPEITAKKLLLRNFKTSQAMNFFPVKIAATWNQLPENIVSAGTVNTSKNRLDKYWMTIPSVLQRTNSMSLTPRASV
ncbi:HELP protein [Trinorchestia longiramus]|nr:HELP protein [Trinorchestia longiramus]